MRGSYLCDALKTQLKCKTDSDLAKKLGFTPGNITQLRKRYNLSAKYVARLIKKANSTELRSAIRPIVEFFPIDGEYRLQKKGRLIPFDANSDSGKTLRDSLDKAKGIYSFYNSEGEIIYFGKTEKQTLYSELINAFNRKLSNHRVYRVRHPWGKYKTNKKGDLRKIKKEEIILSDSASYFSAYDISPSLIGSLEAIVIRLAPNDLINIKIESKDMKAFSLPRM
jgi:hypothetical protein